MASRNRAFPASQAYPAFQDDRKASVASRNRAFPASQAYLAYLAFRAYPAFQGDRKGSDAPTCRRENPAVPAFALVVPAAQAFRGGSTFPADSAFVPAGVPFADYRRDLRKRGPASVRVAVVDSTDQLDQVPVGIDRTSVRVATIDSADRAV